MNWKDRKILFVTGKGGVGKSLVAAAVAYEEVQRGRRVLLVEIGETSYYKDFWSLNSVGHEPVPHPLGFDLALWSGESSLREYVLYYLKMESLYRLFFDNKVMRSLINVAPGLSEIAILGKITSGIRKVGPELNYDLIVVDAYATGHAMALFRAPKGMMEAIQFGPMGHNSREIQDVIQNPELTAYLIVTLLEELPVVETLELRAELKSALGVDPTIVANKVLASPLSLEEVSEIQSETSIAAGVKEFSGWLGAVLERQKKFLHQLRHAGRTVEAVPLIFEADPDALVIQAGEALRAR